MILTVLEVKEELKIAVDDTSKDKKIERLILAAQSYIIKYTCNDFFTSNSIFDKFLITAKENKIESSSCLLDLFLYPDADIYLSGSTKNEGYYKISGMTSQSLIVSEALRDDCFDGVITHVIFPDALKNIALKMVKDEMDDNCDKSIVSETIGNEYSVSYDHSIKESAYKNMLKTFRKREITFI